MNWRILGSIQGSQVNEERSTERSQRTKSVGRREKINRKRVEMTETSEEEGLEKRGDEDEMNGYEEETRRDKDEECWDGLEGRMEENVGRKSKMEQSQESSKSRKRKAKKQKRRKYA